MTILSAFVVLLTLRIAVRFGPRMPMAVGQLLMATGLLSLAVAAAGAPVALVSALTIPVGLGAALSVPTLTALLVGSVPVERVGIASGVLNTSRQLGSALAVGVFGALVAHRESSLHGLQVSLLLAALLRLAAAAASLFQGKLPGTARPRAIDEGFPPHALTRWDTLRHSQMLDQPVLQHMRTSPGRERPMRDVRVTGRREPQR